MEKAVRRVKGVRGIAEEIKVRYLSDKKTADDEIAKRALSILRWNAVVPSESVHVKVQDGWIALSGQVEWQFQRAVAENDIRRLSGVVGVVNAITIKAKIQPTDVKHRIEAALKRNAETDAQRIRVSVLEDGKVALEGSVPDWQERNVARWAAWSVPGVTSIDNRLTIN